jgi:hypothetical protein
MLRWTGSGERLFPVEYMIIEKNREGYSKNKAI